MPICSPQKRAASARRLGRGPARCAEAAQIRGRIEARGVLVRSLMANAEPYNPWKWPMLVTVYGAMFVAVIMVIAVALM